MKWLKPATDPETSHRTTSSGRASLGLRSTRSMGTRPSTSTGAASGAGRSRRPGTPPPGGQSGRQRPGQRSDDTAHLP